MKSKRSSQQGAAHFPTQLIVLRHQKQQPFWPGPGFCFGSRPGAAIPPFCLFGRFPPFSQDGDESLFRLKRPKPVRGLFSVN